MNLITHESFILSLVILLYFLLLRKLGDNSFLEYLYLGFRFRRERSENGRVDTKDGGD